jgi:DNA-binding XRE family transcriptional regulator
MPHLDALHFELSRQALGTTQAKLGETLGVSRRTAQRWASGGGYLLPERMLDLVQRVHPHNAQLAGVLAATLGSTLEGLGVVQPPPPPLPPPVPAPPPPPPVGIVDAVVCAAAEAMELTPREVRLGLHAAFSRAQEIGLSVEVVVAALKATLPAPASVAGAPPVTAAAVA